MKQTKNINSEIEDMTIMPDGRPFFAWRNELEMLRNQASSLETRQKETYHMMQLLKIASIEQQQEPWTGDILVRFRMIDSIMDLSPDAKYRKYTVKKMIGDTV